MFHLKLERPKVPKIAIIFDFGCYSTSTMNLTTGCITSIEFPTISFSLVEALSMKQPPILRLELKCWWTGNAKICYHYCFTTIIKLKFCQNYWLEYYRLSETLSIKLPQIFCPHWTPDRTKKCSCCWIFHVIKITFTRNYQLDFLHQQRSKYKRWLNENYCLASSPWCNAKIVNSHEIQP